MMINLVFVVLLSSLAVAPSSAIYGIERIDNLTPEEQFERINLATRELNAESELTQRTNRAQRDLIELIEGLINWLDELGKAFRTTLDRREARDIIVGDTVIESPKVVDNQEVPQERCLVAYKKSCWRRAKCNIGQGLFGQCFTNAVKFSIAFNIAVLNAVTFPDHNDCSVVMYPNGIISVVHNIEQKIMNFYFIYKTLKKTKEYLAAFAATLSMALKAVHKLFEVARNKLGNCTEFTLSKSLEIGTGIKIGCTIKCKICGFLNMKPIPEIKVNENDKNKEVNTTIPINVPGLVVSADMKKPDGKDKKVFININNLNVNTNVTFNNGDTISLKEANVGALNYNEVKAEGKGKEFAKLPEEEKKPLNSKISQLLGKALQSTWNYLGKVLTDSGKKGSNTSAIIN